MSEESDVPVYLGHYRVEKTLGQGSYGKVKLATNVKTGQKVALKFILKSNIKKPVHMTRIKREVRLLKLLNHPHIVKLYEVAETNQEIILTTEYASGGELFDYIVAQHRLKEKEARKIFRQIVSAVDYCHANCIIHRDLKPENLLLDVDRNIKIIDFGFANMFDPEGLMGTFCGSPFYASPEMILGKKYIGPEVDIWSMGVILYALLCGHLPFDDSNMKKLYNKIIEGKFNIPDYVSTSARDLITKMIVVDTNTRTTLKDVKSHPWISEDCDGPPENFLPERKVPEALDDAALGKLATYGFDLESSKHKILSDPHSPAFSTYYLILEKNRRESELSNNAKSQPEKIEPPIQSEAKENDSKKDADKEASTSKRRARTLTGGDTAKVQQAVLATLEKRAAQKDKKDDKNIPKPPTAQSDESKSQGRTRRHSVDPGGKEVAELAEKVAAKLKTGNNTTNSNDQNIKNDPDLNTVKGLFNVSTTSNKPPDEIIQEISRTLTANDVKFTISNYTFSCQDISSGSLIKFEIEICKVQRLSLHGLHLKRLEGDTWGYKRLCHKLTSQLRL